MDKSPLLLQAGSIPRPDFYINLREDTSWCLHILCLPRLETPNWHFHDLPLLDIIMPIIEHNRIIVIQGDCHFEVQQTVEKKLTLHRVNCGHCMVVHNLVEGL